MDTHDKNTVYSYLRDKGSEYSYLFLEARRDQSASRVLETLT
jgi:hypothetical protein